MLKKILFTFLLASVICKAQDNRKIFYGIISDSVSVLPNTHIINLQNNIGTYTNDDGKFKTLAKANDTLKISSVGYKTKLYVLKSQNFGLSKNTIYLEKDIIALDEIVIKNHSLTGSLNIDSKKVPKDTIGNLITNMLDGIMNMDFSAPTIEKIDAIDRMKAPVINTDPTQSTPQINLFSIAIGGNKKNKQYKKISILEQRLKTNKKIINTIGRKMFVTEFKIPEDKIEYFVDFCPNYKLKRLIDSEKILELIQFLQEQSVAYLKITNEEK